MELIKFALHGGGTMKNTIQKYEDTIVPVRYKLFALWSAIMFIYIYVDYFALYEPGSLESILNGKVWVFDITQTWLLSALVLMTIPSVMGVLSLMLPVQWTRWTNIIVSVLYIIIAVGNVIGETGYYLFFGSFIEIILLVVIVKLCWKWPKVSDTL